MGLKHCIDILCERTFTYHDSGSVVYAHPDMVCKQHAEVAQAGIHNKLSQQQLLTTGWCAFQAQCPDLLTSLCAQAIYIMPATSLLLAT